LTERNRGGALENLCEHEIERIERYGFDQVSIEPSIVRAKVAV